MRGKFLALLLVWPFAVQAQSITKLPSAFLPLSGSEAIPLVQGGVTKQTPIGTIPAGLLPIISSNTVFGNNTTSSINAAPISVPNCASAASALTWTPGTGFGCNSITSSSLVVGVTPLTNSTSGYVLYNNSNVLGNELATSAATASTIVQRDSSANAYFNNAGLGLAVVTAAGGTTAMTAASAWQQQLVTGSGDQSFTLPDATTLTVGQSYAFNNDTAANNQLVKNHSGALQYTVPFGGFIIVYCMNNSTANGVWDVYVAAPNSAQWGTGALTLGPGTLTVGPTGGQGSLVLWGASSGAVTMVPPGTSGGTLTLPQGTTTLAGLGTAGTWGAAQTFPQSDLILKGSSTGTTTLNSGLSSSSSNTLTLPITASDTLAALGTAQTFSAAQTFTDGDLLLKGSSSGAMTLHAPAAASTYSQTYQAASGTVADLDVAGQAMTGGVHITPTAIGTVSSGTTTIDCGTSPLQWFTNGGASTIAAPANDSSCLVYSVNNGSAGALSFSGFTVGASTGDALDTTSGHKFTISIWRINGVSAYRIASMQ